MNTTPDEFDHSLNVSREGASLEFKEAKNHYDAAKLCRYCAALANEGGGKLILGVSDRQPRRVVNTRAFPDTDDTARNIFDKLRFRVDVEELLHTNGRVLIFHVPPRPTGTACHYEGAYLMRSTEDLVAMAEDRLRRPTWATGNQDINSVADHCGHDRSRQNPIG